VGPWVEGIDQLARGGEHCVWYDPADEAVDLVRYYLRKPDARATIARAGRRHAVEHHTYAHRLALLLEGQEYQLEAAEPPTARSRVDERESDQTRV
jgi:spore maturation protein CgeB